MAAAAYAAARMVRRKVREWLWGPPPPPSQLVANGVRIATDAKAHQHFFSFNATGAKVWPSAHVLAQHLEHSPSVQAILSGHARVLEVGSGLGLAGLASAALGARSVCLTDRLVPQELPDGGIRHSDAQLEALAATVAQNRSVLPASCECAVELLPFGDEDAARRVVSNHGPFDLVIGSDVTFFQPSVPALVRTLRAVTGADGSDGNDRDALVVLAHARRRAGLENAVREELQAGGFTVDVVPAASPPPPATTVPTTAATATTTTTTGGGGGFGGEANEDDDEDFRRSSDVVIFECRRRRPGAAGVAAPAAG